MAITLKHQTFEQLAKATKIILTRSLPDKVLDVERVAILLRSKTITVIYRCNGKRVSTFLAKSAFNGYDWTMQQGWAECFNLETGATYRVSLRGCACGDYIHRQAPNGGKCKHQKMYAEQLESLTANILETRSSELIDPNQVPSGFRLVKDDREYCNPTYFVEIKVVQYRKGCNLPTWVNIGKVIESGNKVLSFRSRGNSSGRVFLKCDDALSFLLNTSDYRMKDVNAGLELEAQLEEECAYF